MADTPADDDIEGGQIRPFPDFIREQNEGDLADELSDGLHDLIDRVRATGKAGSLTLTLKIEPVKKAHGGMIVIRDSVTVKLPEFDRDATMWFVTKGGNPVRQNPEQPMFEGLREVPAVDRPIRDIPEAEAR